MNPAPLFRLIAFLSFTLSISPASAQTQVSPKYSVDADVNALASRGDTLIVGGNFNNVGIYTGGGALFTTGSDQPNLGFPKIIGSIKASTPDGTGGFYVYGNFKKEAEPASSFAYKRIEHILADYSFETAFSLNINVLFDVEKLLYHNGLLYIGGSYINQVAGQNAGDLVAINVTTQQLVNWIPAITHTNLGGVFGLYIAQNTLYIMGGFSDVGGQARKNIAAIELYTGTIKPWNFAANFTDAQSYNDIKLYKNKLIIGGNFGTPGLPTDHACALVDTSTGLSVQYLFRSGGLFGNGISSLYFAAGVTSLTVTGDTLFTFSKGTFDTRITAINLADTNKVLWAKYFNITASATRMEVVAGHLFVGGTSFADLYITDSTNDNPANIERTIKGLIQLNNATGAFINWLPDPVGFINRDVLTMSLAGNNIFTGGNFSHVNGLQRPGILMLKAATQEVLPFNINLSGHSVKDFKIIDSTLYAAGGFAYINGVYQPRSVLAFNLNSGSLLPWSPVNLGTAYSVEANSRYAFLGGQLTEPAGGAGRTKLFAIDRQTGALASWAPNPNDIVADLHLSQDKLYVGGSFTNIEATARNYLAAFDTSSLAITGWNPSPNGAVNAIKSLGSTILVGGNFYRVGTTNCSLFAGVSAQSGALHDNPVPAFIPGSVNTISVKGCYASFGGGFRLNNLESCNNLAVYDLYNKTLLPSSGFCQNIDDLGGSVRALAIIGNDLYFGGIFTKVNGRANASNIERVSFPSGYFDGCGEYVSVQNGNWHSPATWEAGSVPPVHARVRIKHIITVNLPANCFSLLVDPGGSVNVNSGVELKVAN